MIQLDVTYAYFFKTGWWKTTNEPSITAIGSGVPPFSHERRTSRRRRPRKPARWTNPRRSRSGLLVCFFSPDIHPRRLTWNLRIHPWKRKIIFQFTIFRFYVNLRGCNYSKATTWRFFRSQKLSSTICGVRWEYQFCRAMDQNLMFYGI